MAQPFKPYHAAVRYLERLASSQHDQAYMHNRNNNPAQYVERTAELVKRLGNPCQGVRVIHVAGTAGKGTTTAYLHTILHAAGFRVGSFTSPYATTSIEKIKVDDKLIDPLVFAKLVDRIKPVIVAMGKEYEYGRPSYFEIFFAISLLYFQKMKCKYMVLEVGCGGRYDAGMIFPKAIAAITNIGLDHTQLLGKTLPKIAKEKAGIIRQNSHVFTTEKRPSILTLFKKIAKERNTKLHIVTEKNNAALAAAVAAHLNIKDSIITRVIASTSLPARFEIMQQNPLVVLDGAHNPMKIASVVHNLKRLTYRKLYTIFASSSNKDAATMLRLIGNMSDTLVLTQFKNSAREAFTPETLKKFTQHPRSSTEPNPKRALKEALKKLGPRDCLLVTGSFYLVGALRKKWISEEIILTTRTTNPMSLRGVRRTRRTTRQS